MERVGNDVYFKDYDWYDLVEECERKSEALQEKGRIESLKEVRGTSNMTFWEWVHRRVNDYTKLDRGLQWRLKQEWDELNDDNESTEGLEDYLIPDETSYFLDEEEESFKERKCRLLGIPYHKPPTFIVEKYEVIKYSFGPLEEYAAIKMNESDKIIRTENNVANAYQEIFSMKDDGWFATRTK